jgi:hypothetical protein
VTFGGVEGGAQEEGGKEGGEGEGEEEEEEEDDGLFQLRMSRVLSKGGTLKKGG